MIIYNIYIHVCVYMCAGDVSQKIRPSQTGRSIQPTDQLRHFERPRPNFGTRLAALRRFIATIAYRNVLRQFVATKLNHRRVQEDAEAINPRKEENKRDPVFLHHKHAPCIYIYIYVIYIIYVKYIYVCIYYIYIYIYMCKVYMCIYM